MGIEIKKAEIELLIAKIKHYEKRLILVSNIETYRADDAIRKSTLMFKITGEINKLIVQAYNCIPAKMYQ